MIGKKQARKTMYVMYILLILLLICSGVFILRIFNFNHTARTYDSGEACDDFAVMIQPRTGKTDSWPKILEENGQSVNYKGVIYDVTLNNIGKNIISEWYLRIDITQDLYLNNAWCGKFEIHQNTNGQELVQTVDLRNYSKDELKLQYTIADPDLLIPLHQGDYLIYKPDFDTDEYPVLTGDSNKMSQVVFGIIFYDQSDKPLEFNNLHMDYYLHETYTQNPFFWILCFAFFIWFTSWIAFIAVELNMKKAMIRFSQDEQTIQQSIGVFTRFFEAKDTYTNGHSQRVADYTKLIAEKLGLSEEQVRQYYYIALMHDCGKCYITDSILKKQGKLTQEEYEIIKSHTVKGAEMLEHFESIDHIQDGVLYHHERYDGKGYPSGLSGEKIPFIARVICIADSFDAMNSRRCYRDTLSKDYIISEFERNKGKQFDPHLTDVFLSLIKEGKVKFTKENSD